MSRQRDPFDLPAPVRCLCGAVEPEVGSFARCVDCESAGDETAICRTCDHSYEADPFGQTWRCAPCQDDAENLAAYVDDEELAVPFAANH